MTTHVVADDVLGGVARKQWELDRRVLEGSLDPAYVTAALQEVLEGKFELTDKFARFTPLLLTLEQQFELICRYNQQYWDGYFSDKELEAYRPKLVSDHQQSVTDLLVFHVEFGSLEETIEMWWRVFMGEQPGHWRWESLKLDSQHCMLVPSHVATYPPKTITQVRLNLVSHWEPEEGRTLEQVRERVAASGEILAHTEVMSAYGLHTALFREQDGDTLPWADLAGTDVMVPGESERHALYVYWAPGYRKARLLAYWVDNRSRKWAAPVVRES